LLHKPIRIDRRLRDGERFHWEEHAFDVYFAPGQTEYHSVLGAGIDGRKIAFAGDNFFVGEAIEESGIEKRPYQTTVFRNIFQLTMHRRCAEAIRTIRPQLVYPGHRDRSILRFYRTQGRGISRSRRRAGRPFHRPVLGSLEALTG
jgi:glyoxylase-like metal-dependent hydrolase (beta-lactamase superfamily II)